MKYLRYFKENLSLDNNDGILFIVDVQSQFEKFIPKNFVSKVDEYCEGFTSVYQIWDSNKAKKPTYKFKNQVATIEKQFGVKKHYKDLDRGFEEWSSKIFDEKVYNNILKLLKTKKMKEGNKFKLKDKDEYLVYIDNEHSWFYVHENMYKIFKKLKDQKVILVGGADDECLKDIYISAESFGLIPIYNYEYIYSAKTNNKQISQIH